MTKNNYNLGVIPFLIGAYETPKNPHDLPTVLPFSYSIDPDTNILKQTYANDVEACLQTAYENGTHPGTPMDIEGDGAGYLFDFFSFIEKTIGNLEKKEILEIGCGQGALLKLMQDKEANVIGVEPGKNHSKYWKNNGVTVVNDFFPCDKINNKFDFIIAYAVLEHINNAEEFVKAIANQLKDNGKIILAVPNCEEQLKNCDPSLFVHEHYSYFSKESLAHFLEMFRFKINEVTYAGYGGSIYICAEKAKQIEHRYTNLNFDIEHFAKEIDKFKEHLKMRITDLNKQEKTLGIYCPSRALSSIPVDGKYRFFDDDKEIYGLYYPPFNYSIENKQDLLNNPVDEIWIFSYSFGDKIKDMLVKQPELAQTKILTLSEIKNET